ncbi:hypothetical protein DNC80_15520, partial [Flavobacterium sp. SOK18b]|uniref:hypothetical protein n=1 Tax=Flavobacterium sp. SOK18b TaxID=797900 RepID=UPI0015FBC90F
MSNFLEITSNDNWFKLHPDKIAGVEYETTSFYFPIMVKGTKDDVLRVTGMLNNFKEHEKNVKKWQDFIKEPLRAAIPTYLHKKPQNEILKIEKDL